MKTGVILSLLLSATGIGVGAVSLLFLQNIQKNSKRAMASLQLNPEKTNRSFRVLFWAQVVEMAAFLIYTAGGFLEMGILMNLGRIITLGFVLLGGLIGLRWWRWIS